MTNMFKTITTATLTAATLAMSAVAGHAFSWETALRNLGTFEFDICEDVSVTITNEADIALRVLDLDYWDASNSIWRSEPTYDFMLDPGESRTIERNLEQVEDADTKIAVAFRDPDGPGNAFFVDGWRAETPMFECTEGYSITVPIDIA